MLFKIVTNIISLGTDLTDDPFTKKQINKSNYFTFGFSVYIIFITTINLFFKNYEIAIKGFIDLAILIINILIFKKFKNIKLYTTLLSGIFFIACCETLFSSAYKGSSLIGVGVIIITIMNILDITTGTIFAIGIILIEIFVYVFNTRITWLTAYPELINELFIRFIGAHIGIFSFTLHTLKRQNELYSQLKKEKEEKEHLFINIVHDIKTPLTIIHNTIENYTSGDQSTDKELLKDNILRMEKNIVNILNSKRLEDGSMKSSSSSIINVSQKCTEVYELYKEFAYSKNIYMSADIEQNIFIDIDETSFTEILTNLIDNSIKYNKPNGKITIKLEKNENNLLLKISDTGIGIPENDQEKIFNKYYQAHKRLGNYYGLGIGLSFVKKMCETYNGEIKLLDSSENGSTFAITFPLSYTTSSIDSIEKRNDNKKTILIIEDNIDIQKLLLNSFKDQYNILLADDGEKGLLQYNKNKNISLIITDYMMPNVNGMEFISFIRKENKSLITPIIFLTAYTSKNIKEDILNLGAVDFLYKPFSVKELKYKVDSIINIFNNRNQTLLNSIGNNIKDYITNNITTDIQPELKENIIDRNLIEEFSITKREEVIIGEIYKGLTNKEIAYNLKISINTVKTHLYRIYKKCNLNNSTALIKLFYRIN